MSDLQKIVLVGDPNKERFKWFQELLADVYAIGAVRAKNFEEIKRFALDKPDDFVVSVVFITDDLPLSLNVPKTDPYINFIKLEEHFYEADFVCIVTQKHNPDLEKVNKQPHLISLRSFPPMSEENQKIIIQLKSLGRLRPAMEISAITEITEWDKDNRLLRRQIRSLSDRHELADGEKHLLRLIRNCLDCSRVTKIEIKQLGQGKSGASVFHLIMSSDDQTKEYVLKINDALWKLESEVYGHLEALKSTELPEYKQHVAALRKPVFSIKPNQHEGRFIVNSGHWYGIHYDFLGGSAFGKFIDLETELTADPTVLIEKTKEAQARFRLTSAEPDEVLAHRLKIFSTTLDGLCEIWYKKKSLGTRRTEAVWQIEDAPEREFIPLPPYRLTRRVKGWVQDFLDSREASIGIRLFPDWNTHRSQILKLVSDESIPATLGNLCRKSLSFTLSPVHGDLNANNVLLWLNYDKYPFLIDLPFFHRYGHILQDFARLETEIKFNLMDRQEESPIDKLAAFDNTISQVPLWIEMEDLLMSELIVNESASGDTAGSVDWDWKSRGFRDNVTLCYKLIRIIREKGREVQQKALDGCPSAEPFAVEYLPALLYHTVRSVGYPSLSVFKRLLAVHSSGLILDRLIRQFTEKE